MRAITAKEAKKINRRLGLETWEDDSQKTFWAYDEEFDGIYVFDSKKERDAFVAKHDNQARQEAFSAGWASYMNY